MKVKNMNSIDRRDFLKIGAATGSLLVLGQGHGLASRFFGKKDTPFKIIILGLDGIDPHLLRFWMDQGKLPAFKKFLSQGDFRPLRTSIPPQSPVAWSNFITGMNPGGHGIFDFLHRNPENYYIIPSGTQSVDASKTITLGNLILPLSGGKITNQRRGKAFWQILEDYDIPATIFKIPSNYPPVPTNQRTISGMGTPDISGTAGRFNYYTTEAQDMKPDIGGGRIHPVYVIGNRIDASLPGPKNPFKKNKPEMSIDFKVYVDPVNPVAKIIIQDHEFIIKEGEWSNWKNVRFKMIPTKSISGICFFYLKQIRPEFKLYVSPINIDPSDAALPIATPDDYAKELSKRFGSFYTQGLPADTKALDHGVFSDAEFLHQDDIVLRERMNIYEYELERFNSGLLFYYVSSTDQRQHMFWRLIDKNHPKYEESLAARFGGAIENIYIQADQILDKAMKKLDKNTILIVMSDHGFSSFRYSFNMNTWLKENGFLSLIDENKQGEDIFFMNTDWSRTKAYALGLNSLYINQKGREQEGIVNTGVEKKALVRDIASKLENFKDSRTGNQPVLRAFVTEDVYSGKYKSEAPDIILGFNRDYRISWATPLGRIPKSIIEDNKENWSGDHCVAPEVVPGILFMNRKIKASHPALEDLTATILSIFGIPIPSYMTGKTIL